MSKRKRSNFEPRHKKQLNETDEERETRLEQQRVRAAMSRAAETVQRRQDRLEKQRLRTALLRASESIQRRQNRLEKQRIRTALMRTTETVEQRQSRLEHSRVAAAMSRATESEDQRKARLEQQRVRTALARATKKGIKSTESPSSDQICPKQRIYLFPERRNMGAKSENYMFEHNCSSLNIKCEFCNVLHFEQGCSAAKL